MPRSKRQLCRSDCLPSPFPAPFLLHRLGMKLHCSPLPSLGSPSPSGNYQDDHAASHRRVPGASGKRMAAFGLCLEYALYLASQRSWVVLGDSLWHSWMVMFKPARTNSWFPRSLCFSGLLISLPLLCSLDADIWKKFLSRPALPFILRLLRGLAIQHPATQVSSHPHVDFILGTGNAA